MKNKIILIAMIAVLAAGVAVFAILNSGGIEAKQASQDNATVTIAAGDLSKTFDLEYLKKLQKVTFNATVDTSSTEPEQKSFGGVPLITVLNDLGISLDGAKQVVFKAADGYVSVVTASEAEDSENVYVVYERDGKLTGTKQQGGTGPIEIVIRKDQFAQRWCKFLMEMDIE